MAIHEAPESHPQRELGTDGVGPRLESWIRWLGGIDRGSIVPRGCTQPTTAAGGKFKRGRSLCDRKEPEPWAILYFKAYTSNSPVIEQAIETAALMSERQVPRLWSRMILRGFLGGSEYGGWKTKTACCLLRDWYLRLVIGLPKPERKQLVDDGRYAFDGMRANTTREAYTKLIAGSPEVWTEKAALPSCGSH